MPKLTQPTKQTEVGKSIMSYVAGLSVEQSAVEQRVVEANPLLEAFGNARTGYLFDLA